MTKGFKNYVALVLLAFLLYFMINVVRGAKSTTKDYLVKVYALKNFASMFLIAINWLTVRGYLGDFMPPAYLSVQIVIVSTVVLFIVQVLGLFTPSLISNVDAEIEKEFPLKRIKENMFFMLFNGLHVLILVSTPDSAPQYLMMFLQIFTFFEMCNAVRIYNSLITSLFTILTALQYYLWTGHGFEPASLHAAQVYIGLELIDRNLTIALIYFNAFAPVIFCISWSLQMVIKQQDSDEKLADKVLDMSKDENNTSKDIIVLRKKICLNMVHEFCLRCLFFLYAAYMSSMLLTSKVLVSGSGEKEYVTNKFFIDTLFVSVVSVTTLLVIYFLSFA